LFSLKEKITNNKIVKTILEITIFVLCLPILTVLLKSIFALGCGLGTYTRIIGY